MSRGKLSSFAASKKHKDAQKEWDIELETYHKYWYDLIVNPNEVAEYFDSRKLIVDCLRGIKQGVESELETRFIYFICSRERVRFDTTKKPIYNACKMNVEMHVLVGRAQSSRSIFCQFFDVRTQTFGMPDIQLTEKYITIDDGEGNLITSSIHEFLENSGIALGFDSKVEYVGNTKNPDTRPTNGAHTGLSDILYKIAGDHRDSLIYFNLFRVVTRTAGYTVLNADTDEVGVELEGDLLEKIFIFYFDSDNQNRNKAKELLELKNNLNRVLVENKIGVINVDYEFQKKNEYGVFSSSKVFPKPRHVFSVRKSGGDVEIARDSKKFEKVV